MPVRLELTYKFRTYPILYERLTLCSSDSATLFLRTLHCQSIFPHRNYALRRSSPLPRSLSLTLSSDIPISIAKPLLSQVSKHLITYTIIRNFDNPDNCLRFLRSPNIRRVALIYTVESPQPLSRFPREEAIPDNIMASVSHLALISNRTRGGWTMRDALITAALASGTHSLERIPFANLTCFAISDQRWLHAWPPLVHHAKSLRCFAILGSQDTHRDNQYKSKILRELRSPQGPRDPRFVLVGYGGLGEPQSWRAEDGFRPNEMWGRIEQLVAEHYICDDGEKWEQSIVTNFRTKLG